MKINLEKNRGLFITFLALLAATPPLSTDMYLAAIPHIANMWGVLESTANLTLVLWFGTFSFSTLIFGSLSDKYGRKPALVTGLCLFVFSSVMCSASQNISQLIIFRILQGFGAGAPAAIGMAIIRDKYTGRERQQAIAYVLTIVAVAPMVAPIIGAMMLEYFSWRFIFLTQFFMVSITLLISFSFKESIQEKLDVSVAKLVSRYIVHFRNGPFMTATLITGVLLLPFYGFIAFSPIFYITVNGLSEKLFSLFFAINAIAFMTGSFTSSRIVKYIQDKKVITISVLGCLIGGLGILTLAKVNFLFFTLFMFIYSFSTGINRPVSGGLILGLVKTDVGSASSLLVFYQFMAGACSMALVTYHWADPVMVFGLLCMFVPIFVLIFWLLIVKSLNPVH